MFPIPFNFPFIRKDGSRTTIGAAIGEGGGGDPYELPTASATTKGGVKIGTGLEMDGEVLKATGGGGGGTQLYYKDFENLDFSSGWTQIGGDWYGGSTSANSISVSGYTPCGVTIIDNYTGYSVLASINKSGTSGTKFKLSLIAKKNTYAGAFSARVYYIKDTDLTPIPTT